MNTDIVLKELFPKHLFWDVDVSRLDIHKDRDLIIPRALMATTTATFSTDILLLERLYKRTVIIQELKATREKISNQVCLLIARRYHIRRFSRFAKIKTIAEK